MELPPPPWPEASAPTETLRSDTFRSGRKLANVVRALFLAAIVATGFDVAANLDTAHLLGRLESDANGVSVARLEASGLRIDVAAPVQGALIVAAFAVLIAWTSRLYRNLRPLGVERLRFTEGWAVGGWFVPFVNLVRPKQILNDIWRASDPARGHGDDWWGRPVLPVLHVWWGVLIVSGLMLSSNPHDPDDLVEAHKAAQGAIVADVAFVVAAVLTILVVTLLTNRQERLDDQSEARAQSQWVRATVLSLLVSGAVFGGSLAAFAAVDRNEPRTTLGSGSSRTVPADRGRRTVLGLNLHPGDCIDDPPGTWSLEPRIVTILAVDVVDCRTAHDQEVVARLRHPAPQHADFPGDRVLIEHADVACLYHFERWVGRSYAESELEMTYLWPESGAWESGERTIICIAARPGGKPLVGSVRGSGR